MKNDINNMQGHISDMLAAQGSLSGNLSHAQNDLHDLYGTTGIVLQLMKNSRVFFFFWQNMKNIFFIIKNNRTLNLLHDLYGLYDIFNFKNKHISPITGN